MSTIDSLPPLVLLCVIVIILSLLIEFGYQLGKWIGRESDLSKHPVEASVTTAVLSLMAFMLGFSFATAASRHANRRNLVLEESNTAGTAYLRADLLPPEHVQQTRALIREYVQLRADATSKQTLEEIAPILQRSSDIQDELWKIAMQSRAESTSVAVNLFITTLNELIDIDAKRRTVALVNRLPKALWYTLAFLGALATMMMGFSSGLHGRRSRIATTALIVAFVVVVVLIVDLDRPFRSLIEADGDALRQALGRMQD